MIDLEAEQPTFYWTLETIGDYERDQDKVWRTHRLGKPVVTSTEITCDYLGDDWVDPADGPLRMRLEPDGYYHSRAKGHHYFDFGLKADSPTHFVIVGTWFDEDYGRGAFVAVFPNTSE